jgi:hypothetical protein
MIYGAAMGLAEAFCVVYLRQLVLPEGTPQNDLRALDCYTLEVCREACTIVMLAAVGWLAGRNLATRFGFFIAAFGVWDILYYVGLYLASGWPSSLLEWDCLFLIPCPWYGPVLAPVLISIEFVVSCVLVLISERAGKPIAVTRGRFALLTIGWLIWILSFTVPAAWEGATTHPSSYPWWALVLGMFPSLAAGWPNSWPPLD